MSTDTVNLMPAGMLDQMTATNGEAVVLDTMHDPNPRFIAEELATPGSLAVWLGQMAERGYHLVSIIPITQTNHFNKDVCAVVWVLVERKEAPATP